MKLRIPSCATYLLTPFFIHYSQLLVILKHEFSFTGIFFSLVVFDASQQLLNIIERGLMFILRFRIEYPFFMAPSKVVFIILYVYEEGC